jgi:hypothetical protein
VVSNKHFQHGKQKNEQKLNVLQRFQNVLATSYAKTGAKLIISQINQAVPTKGL